ncbi:MAG: type IX secretion system sortase PorU [Candidatus Marinimicrobia bacterium]|nr:type IX secretion system sortase PorU [Candidatus Neomarinimicrobiota bacterium]
MKRLTYIIFSLSFVLAFAASRGVNVSYPSSHTLTAYIDLGEFHTYQWIEQEQELTRYTFDYSNNILVQDNIYYEIIQLPIAIADQLPTVYVQVLKTEDVQHTVKEQALYHFSDIMKYRDLDFVYLTINPFLADGKIARKLKVEIDFHTALDAAPPDKMNRFLMNSVYADRLQYSRTVRPPRFKKTTVFTGEWLDISINEEGIYTIHRSDLQTAGVSENIEDSHLYLFAGRTFGMPLKNTFPDSADFHLKEVPMLFLDSSQDEDDQWVFYASENSAWERETSISDIRYMKFIRNSYESNQHLRLFVGSAAAAPKRMELDTPVFSGSEQIQEYTYQHLHHEQELINPGKGGELWLGERLSANNSYSFYLNNLYNNESVPAALRLAFGLTTPGTHEFKTYLSDSLLYQVYSSNAKSSDDYDYESSVNKKTELQLVNHLLDEDFTLDITYRGESSTSEGFLDYIDIIYPSTPEAIDGRLRLWFMKNVEARKVHVSGLTNSLSYVFDVDNPFETDYFPLGGSSGDIYIPAKEISSSYLVLNEGHFKSPLSISLLSDFTPVNTTDHASQIDFIIITPDAFLAEALRLASYKENRSIQPLNTLVKTYSEIIDQFNAGNRDPYAIRHFLSNIYHNAPVPRPVYVLLFGDGHYDYQNRIFSTPVYIPYLYESGLMWPCDDIFVMVNNVDDVTNDMAIGRITANNIDEVRAIVDKIIEYDNKEYPGEWQLNTMLVADDPTDAAQGSSFIGQTAFIRDSERLYNNFFPKVMQTKKVYLTEYPERFVTELQTMGRDGAREDIMETFLNGVAFVNFYGHGDPSVWTQEKVFVRNDLTRLDVNRHYPLIIAATCSWGRSDMPEFQSCAEEILTLEANGAIATIATVRSVFHGSSSSANVKFVEDFTTGLFTGSPDFAYTPLFGDAMLYAKNESNNVYGTTKTNNNMKFMFFGDPTVIPAFPQYGGKIDAIGRDTLRALDRVSVSGRALDRDSSSHSYGDFEGRITVYDNDYQVSREYVSNSFGNISTISYYLEGNRLFNGNISFTGGAFSTHVFIPKDIQYHGTRGKVKMMYWNTDHTLDGSAGIDTIHVGGINPDAASDVVGPDITAIVGANTLSNGAVVYDTNIISIVFEDQSGINITGTTGHVLEMRIDNGAQTIDLSDLFSYSNDDYIRGMVNFPVYHYLDEGNHLIEIAAFDNYNNYSQIELSLTVLSEESDYVTNLVNFPNPFQEQTDFTFSSAINGLASLRVYTLSGKPVATLENQMIRVGFNAIPWQSLDDYGHPLAAGVYFYVLEIEGQTERYTYQNKMMILP